MRWPAWIERSAIRLGLLATEKQDEYLSWADERLDELAEEERRMRKRQAYRVGGQELDLGNPVLAQVAHEERASYLLQRSELAPLPPVAERSRMTEKAWQKAVVEVLVRHHYFVYHPQLSKWSARGWPDLSCLGRRAVFLELKDDHKTLSEEQVKVILAMRACGLEVHVLRPHDGLERVAELVA